MTALLIYIFKVAFFQMLLLGVYQFVIRPGNNLQLMRCTLIAGIILPFVLPLISLSGNTAINEAGAIPVFILPEITISANQNTAISFLHHINWYQIIYFTVSILFLSSLCISIIALWYKVKKSKTQTTSYGKIYIDSKTTSPYSFFSWVFFPDIQIDLAMADILLRHEFSHVKHRHSIDRLMSSLFKAFFWFSPFAYLHHRLLSEVHEFQADANVIRMLNNKENYQNLMLAYAGVPIFYPISNSFSSHLKKRIAMINHKQQKIKLVPLISSLLLLAAFTMLTSMVQIQPKQAVASNLEEFSTVFNGMDNQNAYINPAIPSAKSIEEDSLRSFLQKQQAAKEEKSSDNEDIFTVVEEMPEFPGGPEKMMEYLASHIKYPEEAYNKGIQGRVYVNFVIEPDGSATNAKALRGIGGGCDEEAIRVVESMPKWIPGRQRGQAVRVAMNLPIRFTLEEPKKKEEKPKQASKESTHTITLEDGRTVYTPVEEMPEFPGGNTALMEYISSKIHYPEEAIKKQTEGRVFINFIIEADGSISNAKILRGLSPELDAIALDVIRNMPAWKPGKLGTEPVAVSFNIPIHFQLEQ